MIFKKEDFRNGMVVDLDSGERRMLWDGRFIDNHGYISLSSYDDNLNNMHNIYNRDNIIKVYNSKDILFMGMFFRNECLELIWER